MDKQWVIETIDEFARYGRGERGITRLAFSDEDWQARDYARELLSQAGLIVRTDAFGNLIGRLEGTDKTASAVATGSHLDTVPEGGKYDGVVGVIGALAAVEMLKTRGPLTHPLEVIIFTAEESSRFGYATIGSKAMVGCASISAWNKARDKDGVFLSEALAERGLDLAQVKSAARTKEELKAFVELHIEQGKVLERTATTVGIVEAIAAPTRLRITVEGTAAHSGTTAMDERQDALVSAAMIILAVQEIAVDQDHRGTVGTVTMMKVHPNVMNVIPGLVELGVDIRGVDQESIIETIQEIKDAISTIAEGQDTPVSIEVLTSEKPVHLNPDVTDIIEVACQELSVSCRRMNSGAGHDAMNMAQITKAGIIFIPCRSGVSHNLDEYATEDDIMQGIEVLAETLYQLAK